MEQPIKVNDLINLKIKRMGINGEGIAYHQRLAVFIENGLPGEEVIALITEVHDNRAYGTIHEMIKESKNRTVPFCDVYIDCGGCQTQHYDYDAMLKQKKDIIIKALDRYVKDYDKQIIKDTVGMQDPLHYRNKASLPVRKLYGKNRFGMYQRNSNVFIPIDNCSIQHESVNIILKTIIKLMDQFNQNGFDPKTNEGFITNITVRITENLREAQVGFTTNTQQKLMDEMIYELIDHHPEIVSIYQVIDISHQKQKTTLIYGKETITENINGQSYELGFDMFFQLNTEQAEKFYTKMQTLIEDSEYQNVLDGNKGLSPIGMYLYQQEKPVFILSNNLIEQEKIKDLQKKYPTIHLIDSYERLKLDLMVFDPSRLGIPETDMKMIFKVKPKRIIYGSCNPSTLAKDLETLKSLYEIVEITPFDMFPYTSLVESITLLKLKG